MTSDLKVWEQLASEFQEGMQLDLRGVHAIAGVHQLGAAMAAQGALVRTRGALRKSRQAAGWPSKPVPVVVIDVSAYQPTPRPNKVKGKLRLKGAIDLYYIVRGKHWAALEPRELNPNDQEHGEDHRLFLIALKPDFIVTSSVKDQPPWCSQDTQVIEW